jgi:hypothetical protein
VQKGSTLKVMEEFNIQDKQTSFYKYCPGILDTPMYCITNSLAYHMFRPPIVALLVENNCVMTVVTQLYLGKYPENNYMFRPLVEWAIIRLKQEITEKITDDNM